MKKLILSTFALILLTACSKDESSDPLILEDTFYKILEGETKVTEFAVQVKPSEVSGNYLLAYELVNLIYDVETEEHIAEGEPRRDTLLVSKDTIMYFEGGLKAFTVEPLDSHSGFLQVRANDEEILTGEVLEDRYITFYIPYKY